MKKLVCTMLSLLLCFLLPVSASALNISADRSASSVIETAPFSLVETNSPAGAVGIAYDLSEGTTRYLGVFGNVLSENDQILSVPGWFPQTASLSKDGEYSTNTVIDGETFTKVPDVTVMPYSAILFGYSYCDFCNESEGIPTFTAFMISPTVAVTAAHAVYHTHDDPTRQSWSTSIAVLYGLNGEGTATGFGMGYETVIPVQYYETKNDNYDWALIRFTKPIGNSTGYFGYQYIPSATLEGITATLCGYPGSEKHKEKWYYQWQETGALGCFGTNAANYNYVTRYKMDSLQGQSGAPLFRYHEGKWSAVAIHTAGYTSFNEGVRITGQMFRFFIAYAPT